MSSNLIGLICALSLIIGCSGELKYDNPVPLQIGNATTIKCDFDEIENWFLRDKAIENDRRHKLSDDKKLLEIIKTDYSDEGNYTCVGKSGEQKVFVAKGKPRFKITTSKGRIDVKSIHADEGTHIDMICFIPNKAEIPLDERYSFKWYKGDSQVNIKQDAENARQHTLTIDGITQLDRDVYRCVASNGVQEHSESIRLRVKDKLSYIWPSIGIVCEVVILVLIILIFEKRGVKPEYEESDNDANTDVKKST